MGRKPELRIVTFENIELGNRYLSSKKGIIYDTENNMLPISYYIPSSGYYSCYLSDIYDTRHNVLVHRVIANTWISSVIDMDVHHKNHNRTDPSVKNLEVLSMNMHRVHHNRGSNNNTAKLKEKDVHQICQYLNNKITHKKIAEIMSATVGIHITVDSIDKIANGSNWKSISSLYNIKPEPRETMNQFSSRAKELGKLKASGKSNREIADMLDIKYDSKEFVRLIACLNRYSKKYANDD